MVRFLRIVPALSALLISAQAAAVPRTETQGSLVAEASRSPRLRSAAFVNTTSDASRQNASTGKLPCTCQASNPAWLPCRRTVARCVFIDLGAAHGNTFNAFMNNEYGPVASCPNGQWSAVLVEANPRFDAQLSAIGQQRGGSVNVLKSTAAFMCEGTTSFYLDTVNTDRNFWGSSMSSSHPDVQRSGQQKVTVPTVNLNRILYEETIPGDWVMVKMDIEGAEWDVLPCLAQGSAASLIDRLYLEQHDVSWGNGDTTPAQMEAAKVELRHKGVDIPDYFSHTL